MIRDILKTRVTQETLNAVKKRNDEVSTTLAAIGSTPDKGTYLETATRIARAAVYRAQKKSE